MIKFFIDEIHRLSPVVEEFLYSAMEDYKIDIMLETGPNARSVQISLNPFTLVGATTMKWNAYKTNVSKRFGIQCRLEYYNIELLSTIIQRSAVVLGVPIYEDVAIEIARRSRGTPRIANALLRRVRDFAEIKGNGNVELKITQFALNSLNVDEFGLDEMDNKIMRVMIENFKGRPVGISALAHLHRRKPRNLGRSLRTILNTRGIHYSHTARTRSKHRKSLQTFEFGSPQKILTNYFKIF